MSESTSIEHIDQLFETAMKETASLPALERLHRELVQGRERLKQPMRVAIVGFIKAGKSTAMNALLGEEVVATGTIETTFNVNWLCYGERKFLEVHYKDNRPVETRSFEELGKLTRRAREHYQILLAIKYIKVYFPNEMFRVVQIVDTPGLGSIHEADSENTRVFINAHGKELAEMTVTEASQADAVLYLFSRSISASAEEIIKEFQGPLMGSATPINSIGVLTKVDFYWPSVADPFDGANRIVKRLQAEPQVQRLLYTITPVCVLLALGAQTLVERQFVSLNALASVPEALLKRRLRDAERFTTEIFDDIPVTPAERAALYTCLGQYGIWRACQHIRSGRYTLSQLRRALLEESGLPQLQKLILAHFGNRASLIKLEAVLRNITTTIFHLRSVVKDRDLEALRKVSRTFEELAMQQEGISELQVLRAYYEGKLSLNPAEVQQLLHTTGEYGTAYWQRLGIQEEENITTLERLEKALVIARQFMRYWRQRFLDPGLDRETRNATQVLARSYERIIYHLQEARRHLDL